jgi:hypothetical protein
MGVYRDTYKSDSFVRGVLQFWGVRHTGDASYNFELGIIYVPDSSWQLMAVDSEGLRLRGDEVGGEVFDIVEGFRFYHPDKTREEERIVERACAIVQYYEYK